MYKLFVVDDEEAIRKGIAEGIDWPALGFVISGLASNGEEALALIGTSPPDIILTDIRMPKMDGLEMIEKIRSEYPGIKCVVLSGYNDFEYAQTALKNKVFGYLLKPTDLREFETTFRKISDELDQERCKKYEYEILKKQVRDSLPLLRERFLNELVRGCSYDIDTILAKIQYLQLDLDAGNSRVFVLEIDHTFQEAVAYSEDETNLLIFAICNIAHEITESKVKSVCFASDVYIITICNSDINNKKLLDIILQIQECVKKYLNRSVSAGIGGLYNNIRELPTSFKEALEALKYRIYTGEESIIFIEDVMECDDKSDMPSITELEKLAGYIWFGEMESLSDEVDMLFDKYLTGGLKPLNYIDNFCMGIIYASLRYFEKMGTGYGSLHQLYDFNAISECETFKAKKDCLIKLLMNMGNVIKRDNNANIKRIIVEIKEYIEKNYCDCNISLNLIADKFCKSTVYISKLFKNETGENFIDYLIRLRIERAKGLLDNSVNMRAFEIAQNVGYTDISHFSKLFKKYTGYSPIEYRERSKVVNEGGN